MMRLAASGCLSKWRQKRKFSNFKTSGGVLVQPPVKAYKDTLCNIDAGMQNQCLAVLNTLNPYSPPLVDRIWLGIYSSKIPMCPIFLLKGDYTLSG